MTTSTPLRATVLDALGLAADQCRDNAAIIRRVATDHWLITALRGDTAGTSTTNRGNPA